MRRFLVNVLIVSSVAGCRPKAVVSIATPKTAQPNCDHDDGVGHALTGPHGGFLIGLGKNHAEVSLDPATKMITVYLLDSTREKSWPVDAESLTFSNRVGGYQVELLAVPQSNDPKGRSSRFTSTDDRLAVGMRIIGTLSSKLNDKPYAEDFDQIVAESKSDDPKESDLYLKPGGIYSQMDIEANGRTTVSIKYRNFKASHDIKPKVGDRICPVTLTKANPQLTWIINGKSYEFCCPPCVDEYVDLAKSKPDDVKAPEAFIKK